MKQFILDPSCRYYSQWASAALHKIGFAIPCLTLCDDELDVQTIAEKQIVDDYRAALKTFQKFYMCDNQEGRLTEQTVATINSILIQKEEIHKELKMISPPPLQLKK